MPSNVYKKSFLRVLIYGIMGTLAFISEFSSFALLNTLFNGRFGLLAAQLISFMCGLLVSFLGNRLVTFNHRQKTYVHTVKKQASAFLILSVINLVLSSIIIYSLVNYLGVPPIIAKLEVMMMVAFWNYTIFNRFIFKSA